MAHELPAKLQVIQALLGCTSRKELCARFRDVNPGTEFDLERSHKWMQGRAQPRSIRVYEDWARLLGTERQPAWLVACTLDAFIEEVCRLFAADPLELRRRAGLDERSAGGAAAGAAVHYVCGAYAAYSLAWSPCYRDHAIRGSLLIEPAKASRFAARYRESLPSGRVELAGAASLVGRILHLDCTSRAAARRSMSACSSRAVRPACSRASHPVPRWLVPIRCRRPRGSCCSACPTMAAPGWRPPTTI